MAKTVTFAYDYLNRWVATEVDTDPDAAGGETSEYFVYGQATLPDEVAARDRAATGTRDIGQIVLRLDEDGEISNRYLWGPAVDQILADEQISSDSQGGLHHRPGLLAARRPPGHRPGLGGIAGRRHHKGSSNAELTTPTGTSSA